MTQITGGEDEKRAQEWSEIWVGHMQDLLGLRRQAIETYRSLLVGTTVRSMRNTESARSHQENGAANAWRSRSQDDSWNVGQITPTTLNRRSAWLIWLDKASLA